MMPLLPTMVHSYTTHVHIPARLGEPGQAVPRKLSDEEQQDINRKLNRTYAKFQIPTYSTLATDLLAHAGKQAMANATIAAGVSQAVLRSGLTPVQGGHNVLSAAVGLLSGFFSYVRQAKTNGDILHLVKYMPPNATLWHLKKDSVYQHDQKMEFKRRQVYSPVYSYSL